VTLGGVLLCVLAVLPGAGEPLAQAPQNPVPVKVQDCKKCKAQGRLPCPEHPKSECELETKVVYCSVFIDCPSCHGTGFVVCPACQDPVSAAALEKRRAELQERRLVHRPLDDAMKRPLRKAESAHIVMVWDIDRMKVDKKFLNAHELLHLYLFRMEDVYADYVSRLGLKETDYSEKLRFFVWNLFEDMQEGSLRFCGQSGNGPMKLMGIHPSYSVCGHKRYFQSDEHLHRNLVHVASHLLLSAQDPVGWIGNIKGGWLDEGLAHWYEDHEFNVCDTYCYQEANDNPDFKGGRFRLNMRQMVTEGKVPAVADVFQQNIDTLTLPMHAAAFSYVDYLLTQQEPSKFNQLAKRLKAKMPTRDALKEIYGFSPMEFEALWKSYVLATYPTR
jgi:hypothetical protein